MTRKQRCIYIYIYVCVCMHMHLHSSWRAQLGVKRARHGTDPLLGRLWNRYNMCRYIHMTDTFTYILIHIRVSLFACKCLCLCGLVFAPKPQVRYAAAASRLASRRLTAVLKPWPQLLERLATRGGRGSGWFGF